MQGLGSDAAPRGRTCATSPWYRASRWRCSWARRLCRHRSERRLHQRSVRPGPSRATPWFRARVCASDQGAARANGLMEDRALSGPVRRVRTRLEEAKAALRQHGFPPDDNRMSSASRHNSCEPIYPPPGYVPPMFSLLPNFMFSASSSQSWVPFRCPILAPTQAPSG